LGTVYSGIIEDFTAQDFTVDCNVAGQLTSFVACAAVSLPGRHIRIRRVRAINFGSQTKNYVENFVFFLSTIHPDSGQTWDGRDNVFEDCIAEQPGVNSVNNSTAFTFGGGEIPPYDGRMYYHRGCVMRNNYINTELWFGPLVQIEDITYNTGDGLATLTAKGPHGLTVPGNVLVKAAALSNGSLERPANPYNGVFAIHSIQSDSVLKYRPSASIISPSAGTATGGTIGGGVSSLPVEIDKIELVPGSTRKHTITTLEPHFRTTNNNVLVAGVLKPGVPGPVVSKGFNGVFAVDPTSDPSKPNELVYELLADPDVPATDLIYSQAVVTVGHIATSAEHGTAAVMEGNRILHCDTGGSYHDTWPTRDLIVRDNYYHDVHIGPNQNLTGLSFWVDGISVSLVREGPEPPQNKTAIATTSVPHGFSVNDFVIIFGADDDNYNSYPSWQITAVPDAKTFKYSSTGTLSPSTSGAKYRVTENLRPLQSLTRDPNDHRLITAIMAPLLPNNSQKHGLEKGDAFILSKAGLWNAIATSPYNGFLKVDALDSVSPETKFQFYLSDPPWC